MGSPPIQQINSTSKIKLEPSKTHVTLKFQADDHDVYYRVQRDYPLHHVKLDYCNRFGHGYGAVRFVCGGVELRGTKTPDDLQMKDGCTIDAWVDKIGG